MKSVSKIIGVTAALALLAYAGYFIARVVSECYEELDLEEDCEYD